MRTIGVATASLALFIAPVEAAGQAASTAPPQSYALPAPDAVLQAKLTAVLGQPPYRRLVA